MRSVLPIFIRELRYGARECVKWTLVGVGILVCMWAVTEGVPRVISVINGLSPAHGIHPVATPLDATHHVTHSR